MIDAHVHMITAEMVQDATHRFDELYPDFTGTASAGTAQLTNPSFIRYLKNTTPEMLRDRWLESMDENGLARAVFFPISERPEQLKAFIDLAPDRFIGYAFINRPTAPDAPERLRKQIKEFGFKGLKLYPSLQCFHAYERSVFPLYEEAMSLGIPITFHMGITHALASDYRYTNPLDLQLPMKLFTKLNFVIAHFGAGFFRELLLLGFHANNLFVDTSGTNNWREYVPEKPELEFIFKRTIDVFGAERILLGTDTVMRPDTGYRSAILAEQVAIVNRLCEGRDAERILGANAWNLFG